MGLAISSKNRKGKAQDRCGSNWIEAVMMTLTHQPNIWLDFYHHMVRLRTRVTCIFSCSAAAPMAASRLQTSTPTTEIPLRRLQWRARSSRSAPPSPPAPRPEPSLEGPGFCATVPRPRLCLRCERSRTLLRGPRREFGTRSRTPSWRRRRRGGPPRPATSPSSSPARRCSSPASPPQVSPPRTSSVPWRGARLGSRGSSSSSPTLSW